MWYIQEMVEALNKFVLPLKTAARIVELPPSKLAADVHGYCTALSLLEAARTARCASVEEVAGEILEYWEERDPQRVPSLKRALDEWFAALPPLKNSL